MMHTRSLSNMITNVHLTTTQGVDKPQFENKARMEFVLSNIKWIIDITYYCIWITTGAYNLFNYYYYTRFPCFYYNFIRNCKHNGIHLYFKKLLWDISWSMLWRRHFNSFSRVTNILTDISLRAPYKISKLLLVWIIVRSNSNVKEIFGDLIKFNHTQSKLSNMWVTKWFNMM